MMSCAFSIRGTEIGLAALQGFARPHLLAYVGDDAQYPDDPSRVIGDAGGLEHGRDDGSIPGLQLDLAHPFAARDHRLRYLTLEFRADVETGEAARGVEFIDGAAEIPDRHPVLVDELLGEVRDGDAVGRLVEHPFEAFDVTHQFVSGVCVLQGSVLPHVRRRRSPGSDCFTAGCSQTAITWVDLRGANVNLMVDSST